MQNYFNLWVLYLRSTSGQFVGVVITNGIKQTRLDMVTSHKYENNRVWQNFKGLGSTYQARIYNDRKDRQCVMQNTGQPIEMPLK